MCTLSHLHVLEHLLGELVGVYHSVHFDLVAPSSRVPNVHNVLGRGWRDDTVTLLQTGVQSGAIAALVSTSLNSTITNIAHVH